MDFQGSRVTDALRAHGFTIFSAAGEKLAPTARRRNYTTSRAEMMEIIVYKIKETYFPHQVNVATWDAALDMDVAKCCGLEDCGTARNGSGLEYCFAIFRGVGEINWTGETTTAEVFFAQQASKRNTKYAVFDVTHGVMIVKNGQLLDPPRSDRFFAMLFYYPHRLTAALTSSMLELVDR